MFEWDDANLLYIAEHEVSSDEAEEVVANEPLDLEYEHRAGEDRLVESIANVLFENQDFLDQQFIKEAAEGRLGRGTVARRAGIPTTTIRLDPADIARARIQAERRGLRYQTYLKMLIHEALEREGTKAAS